jgi:phosphoglycerate kinase
MAKRTLNDVELKGKTVLMRVDFNVPIKEGVISDDNRIVQALKSINFVTNAGAKLILTSHLGRPADAPDPEFSLKPVADHLATLVDVPVHFAEDCIGEKREAVINAAKDGEIVLLENVRFHPGEKKNDPEFAKNWLQVPICL